jgi:hypothetical protein
LKMLKELSEKVLLFKNTEMKLAASSIAFLRKNGLRF